MRTPVFNIPRAIATQNYIELYQFSYFPFTVLFNDTISRSEGSASQAMMVSD